MDDETPEIPVPDDVAQESAFAGDEPAHAGAEEDRSRPADEDLTTEDLGEGGPAGA